MSEYGNLDQAMAGLQIGSASRKDSRIAQEAIAFGAPVMGFPGEDNKCYAAHNDKVTVTISAALVASDTLAVVINGTTISGTYGTSSDATMTALIAAINAHADMVAAGIFAVAGEASTIRNIVLKTKGKDLTVTAAVTNAGAGTATASVATTTWGMFLGVAMYTAKGGRDSGAGMSAIDGIMPSGGGSAGYAAKDAVSIMNFGRIWVNVPSDASVVSGDSAYLIFGTTNQGKFTNASSGNKSISSVFYSSKNTQNLALLEVRSIVQ